MTPRIPRASRFVAAALVLAAPALAQTITVDRALDDFTDFGGAQRVADLPGPDGHVTIREAVTAANNTPGPQTIAFAIPRSEWSIFYADRALIRLENMLYVSDDETTVDFATQAAFTGDTNPDGGEVGLQYAGVPAAIPCLWIAADDCLVRGLDVTIGNNVGNGLWVTGNRNRVVGCTTGGLVVRGDYGGGAFNVIGGTGPGEGNRFTDGVDVRSRANDNVFVGNTIRWGLRISGDTLYGYCERNRIGGPTAAERNVLAGHGYYGEEGFPLGTQLEVFYARDTLVQGNYVGTTPDGAAQHPGRSGTGGIVVGIGAERTLVRDNLVAGIVMVGTNHYQGQRFGTAISVQASARETNLVGNRLGLAADGVTPIPSVQGVVVQKDPNGSPLDTRIGGARRGEGNEIAHHETTGVRVGYDTVGVRIRGNSIHDNGTLGIDLVEASGGGPTPNDPLDLDAGGGNHLQNFPVLARAVRAGGTLLVRGALASEPDQAYAVDFYASPGASPSELGEARRFLGTTLVTTDALGNASFAATTSAGAPPGWRVTATATHLARGETSELSGSVVLGEIRGLR